MNNLKYTLDCNVRKIYHNFIGDGHCDDGLNNYICNFDGGDCCHPLFNYGYCKFCHCIWEVTNYPILTTPNTSKKYILF